MYQHHHQVLMVMDTESVLLGGLGFNHDGLVKPGGGDCGDVGGTRPGR